MLISTSNTMLIVTTDTIIVATNTTIIDTIMKLYMIGGIESVYGEFR
jgi:hypothetical protein